ncbi:MAG: PatB family C-S lyase [Exilibacterium sp.]
MEFDFDGEINRTDFSSVKWNRYRGRDVIPMWIADADFRVDEHILTAIRQQLDHGVLGYTNPNEYKPGSDAVVAWLKAEYGWSIEPQWIVWMPGVVPAFNVACRAFCQPGDKVLVQTPNYPPLLRAPDLHGLQMAEVPTRLRRGRWVLDLDLLEQKAADPRCTLFLLCNPMNPCGSVFSREELETVAGICRRHGVYICSDEIHCDLILQQGLTHTPTASLPELAGSALTIMSAAKSFNIAGLGAAFSIVPDVQLRHRYVRAAQGLVPSVNVLGLVATAAAFQYGRAWLRAQIDYLRANRDLLEQGINSIDGLSVTTPVATFLAWIDASALGVGDVQSLFESWGVGPSPGRDFGQPQFARINFACPRRLIERALERISAGVSARV